MCSNSDGSFDCSDIFQVLSFRQCGLLLDYYFCVPYPSKVARKILLYTKYCSKPRLGGRWIPNDRSEVPILADCRHGKYMRSMTLIQGHK